MFEIEVEKFLRRKELREFFDGKIIRIGRYVNQFHHDSVLESFPWSQEIA